MMAALARLVHNCQHAADAEHNCHQGNQQGGLHRDLPNAAPEPTGLPNYWGSNEPTVNRRTDLYGPWGVVAPPIVIESYFNCVEMLLNLESSFEPMLYTVAMMATYNDAVFDCRCCRFVQQESSKSCPQSSLGVAVKT
jgi:hypothetical protein